LGTVHDRRDLSIAFRGHSGANAGLTFVASGGGIGARGTILAQNFVDLLGRCGIERRGLAVRDKQVREEVDLARQTPPIGAVGADVRARGVECIAGGPEALGESKYLILRVVCHQPFLNLREPATPDASFCEPPALSSQDASQQRDIFTTLPQTG
jgi:hypothetical protein